MIYKYTKCESVIAKIMADADMSEKNIRITDMREWVFEAVEKIGAPVQYIERESGVDGAPILEVHDFQAPIPEDLESLTAVAYSPTIDGIYVPVRKDESTFKGQRQARFLRNCCSEGCHQPMQYKLPTSQSQFYDNPMPRNREADFRNTYLRDTTYFIKPGWIVLNKKDGFIKLVYKAIATDERGYPLIPDMASYQEAIYWYVMMKLNFPKFLNGSLGGHRKYNMQTYNYLQHQWNFYKNQAYAEAMMPNEGEMMSIKNEWNKLIPDWDSDEFFFKSSGQKQLNYNDYYYGY